ncbi:hypothetical protein PUR61_02080 [Streptomyces sp. BE20]|uniref:hypothetical protein n=1 Tax=Streptomyces sp. BE20 TaxID=3002525 RepID=UPI002E796092|nr:hypothetical protein [Streptomyces sp. BE20]MEE1820995.1 hypothetical protein [Streptomyces sp. BE20]
MSPATAHTRPGRPDDHGFAAVTGQPAHHPTHRTTPVNHAPADTTPTAATPAALLAAVLPLSRHALTWAGRLCGPGTVQSITRSERLPRATVQREITALMERAGTLLRPQLAAQYAAAGLVPASSLPRTAEDPWDLDPADRALLRLLARHSHADIAAELALSLATVRQRAARLRRLLHVSTDHEATALAASRGLVRPGDARPGLPLPAPVVPEPLAPAVAAVVAALARTPEASAQIPPPEQHLVAAAVAHARAGHSSRVLVIAADGPAWDSAMDAWSRAPEHEGTVVGLRPRPRDTPDEYDDGPRALAWTRRGLLDLAGTRQPATVVATPESLGQLTHPHRTPAAEPLTPWDLIVTVDTHTPAGPPRHPGTRSDQVPDLPAAARLTLTSLPPHRLPRDAGPVVARRTAALAARLGRMRGHRLLAVPWTAVATTEDVAAVVLETARRHGLRRVQVVCHSPSTCQRVADAAGLVGAALPAWRRPASSWTGAITPGLPTKDRTQALLHFAEGHEELLVLATCGPLRAPGADALLVLAPHDEDATLEAVEWALEARDRHDGTRTLAVLVPVTSRPALGPGADRAEALLRACAALDPALAGRAAQHPAGSRWPWIDGGPYLDTEQCEHLDAALRTLTTGRAS